ncbi:MAG: glycine zipper 2TM domain-containing protein [Chlamydiales bacterium]|nr:glycine zipper 2TM domain-containing protein [Chlamydiales bacterium]
MKKITLLLVGMSLLAACARETSPDVYDSSSFGEVASTYPGVVLEMKEVTVANGEGLQNNTTGLLGGGLAGALLGSTIGHGKGSVIGTVAGGAIGATGGAAIEQGLKSKKPCSTSCSLIMAKSKPLFRALSQHCILGKRFM